MELLVIGLIGTFVLVGFAGFQAGYIHNNVVLRDGTNTLTGNWTVGNFNINMSGNNYVLGFPLSTWIHIMMDQGVTDVHISSIPSGVHNQDRRFFRLMASLDTGAGVDKTVSFTISDGTDSMTISLTGAELNAHTTIKAFDLDVSAENLTLTYTQTAGGLTNHACVMFHWYYKENAP